MNKLIGIIATVILSLVLMTGLVIVTAPNSAYSMEANIEEARGNITIQEKRRNDLVVNLVDTIKNYNDYEQETMTMIIEARNAASGGDIETASKNIKVITEAYPELKSQDNYKHLMNELSISENTISNYRLSLNRNINDYKRHVRKFPKRFMLSIAGYEVQTYDYLIFEGNETLTDIWK